MKILTVDDSKLALTVLERAIGRVIDGKYKVIKAYNGAEAVLKYKEFSPDICFTDLTMPLLDGHGMIEQIMKYDKNANIIVLSADVQKTTKARALNNGASRFTTKPIEDEELVEILNNLRK
jgi:two-component system, chemotaxis family, chemotaxis protein CheY